MFRDAADEYGSLAAVKRRLEEWKAAQPGAYRDAYVSLSAPALFAPFVRLELLKWRPLHGGDTGGARRSRPCRPDAAVPVSLCQLSGGLAGSGA